MENNEEEFSMSKLEYNFNNIKWEKIRLMLKYLFLDTSILIKIYKNKIIIDPEPAEISKILKEFHSDVIAGHTGFHKTYKKIKQKFLWPNMKSDIANFIKHCDSCQKNKIIRKKTLQPMEITTTAKTSFEKIFLDIVGPIQDTC